MRVIAGKARGTRLISSEGLETRPTSDRIKESLFNIITPDLDDCCFLDLFSGSGGIGIEALSRGAKEVTFVEVSKNALKCIQENIEKTKFKSFAKVLNTTNITALAQFKRDNQKFDIIFMDPPYNKDLINGTIDLITKYELLTPNGYMIVERDSSSKLTYGPELELWKEKKYGKTTISFLRGKKIWRWEFIQVALIL